MGPHKCIKIRTSRTCDVLAMTNSLVWLLLVRHTTEMEKKYFVSLLNKTENHQLKDYPCGVFRDVSRRVKRFCIWESEKERERRRFCFRTSAAHLHSLPSPPRHAAQSTSRRLVTCITNEKEKEDYRERFFFISPFIVPPVLLYRL